MKYILLALAAASLTAAHGFVTNATIDGVEYEFFDPNTDPFKTPVPERISRAIPGNGPVEDVEIADVQCGGFSAGGTVGSAPAALHAPATAGSEVTLAWTLWPESHFGALTTYMAKCPDTGCNDFMPEAAAVWFKVAESGMIKFVSGGATNEWATDSLMVAGNAGTTYTIPPCIADGKYLVRHEIIALFVAGSYPGVQIYPGCHQLDVTGGSGTVTPTDLVGFPGAYTPTDPGITWDSADPTYPIPGPAVLTCPGANASNATRTPA